MNFPYAYISCPCEDITSASNGSNDSADENEEREEEGQTFDPKSPRANFSLYPIEHLLFCEDCQQIRCPRCTVEEIVCWYCPSCLFEMPSAMVKSDGGRCSRNCFNCPVCTSPLAISSINQDPTLRGLQGPWILGCSYCHWSSLDIGMQFERVNNIHVQIQKIADERQQQAKHITTLSETDASNHQPPPGHPGDTADATFTSLQSFYKAQLAATEPRDPLLTPSGGFNYSSPSNLARLMSLYTGRGGYGKKDPSRSNIMREAYDASEGLRMLDPSADTSAIDRLRTDGWRATASPSQQSDQRHHHHHHSARFVDELRPIQPYLRTKRSKRCATCRHILVKPEPKPQSTRYRIKLVAMNYIPTMTLKPLQPAAAAAPQQQGRAGGSDLLVDLRNLRPLRPTQTLLTLKNPLLDHPVRISLATPAVTRGRFKHKITILCPEFEVGANLDQWDEALANPDTSKVSKHLNLGKVEYAGGEGGRVAEAGKVWERGRNWTSVVVEVVCADVWGEVRGKEDELEEDEDVLEIPIFVRMEWEGEPQGDDAGGLAGVKGEVGKEKRELAYWVVLGIGRVGKLPEGGGGKEAESPA